MVIPAVIHLQFWAYVLGLAVSNINESQLQTYESKTLFLMTSLQYYCIPGLAEIKTCAKDVGCAGNKIPEGPGNCLQFCLNCFCCWVNKSQFIE